jgi:choline kinase|tara:strand:- start:95 stop:829 length:735 start_codon:yes stop_codon:yes gene_type:complete
MNAIILAAGIGTRIRSMTNCYPKAMLRVMDKELIRYVVDMAIYVNVNRIVVVGGSGYGYLGSLIHSLYSTDKVIMINNIDYKKGNICSVKCALPYIKDEFLLFNVDHVFSKELLETVMNRGIDLKEVTIFSDRIKDIEDDQMKILLSGTSLRNISKTLKRYDTGYIGLVYCPKSRLDGFIAAVDEVFEEMGNSGVTEDILNHLVDKGSTVLNEDISGYRWFEVDTPEDLIKAEALIADYPGCWI